MKFLFRCDSSKLIGYGHLMRCLNLAKELRARNHECLFFSKKLEGNITHIIKNNNFKLLDSEYGISDTSKTDALVTANLVRLVKPDWVVVDSYPLLEDWESEIRKLEVKLVAIDDIFRKHHAHVVLDQNYHPAQCYQLNDSQKLFQGPEYCLLDSMFKTIVPKTSQEFENVKSVSLFFGGTDSTNQCSRFLKLLAKSYPDFSYQIVIGENAPFLRELKLLKESLNLNSTLHIQTTEMADVLHSSEAFIGAGGSVTWERAVLGVPALCYSVAKNQEAICENLEKIECHQYGGRLSEISDDQVLQQIHTFFSDQSRRIKYHENSLKLKVGSKTQDLILYLENFTKDRPS